MQGTIAFPDKRKSLLVIQLQETWRINQTAWSPYIVARRALRFKRNERKCSCTGGQILPTFLSIFHFLAFVLFLVRSKPKIPILGLSLHRDLTETLATQAIVRVVHVAFLRSHQPSSLGVLGAVNPGLYRELWRQRDHVLRAYCN